MTPGRLLGVAYFADENALGLAKLLIRSGRTDIVHPGHPSLPDVPLGSSDLEWMPFVGRADLIVRTRDRRIRTRPAELAEYRRLGIRSVWIGAKQDLSPQDQLDIFLAGEQRLERTAVKLGAGPWALAMSPSGVRPIRGGGAEV